MVARDVCGGLINLVDQDVGKFVKARVEAFMDVETEVSVVFL